MKTARHRKIRAARRAAHAALTRDPLSKAMKTVTAPQHPPVDVWADIVETAKRRKRSIKSVAEKQGWMLSLDGEPRERESWTR
jgi:uncharacterized protein YcbX